MKPGSREPGASANPHVFGRRASRGCCVRAPRAPGTAASPYVRLLLLVGSRSGGNMGTTGELTPSRHAQRGRRSSWDDAAIRLCHASKRCWSGASFIIFTSDQSTSSTNGPSLLRARQRCRGEHASQRRPFWERSSNPATALVCRRGRRSYAREVLICLRLVRRHHARATVLRRAPPTRSPICRGSMLPTRLVDATSGMSCAGSSR